MAEVLRLGGKALATCVVTMALLLSLAAGVLALPSHASAAGCVSGTLIKGTLPAVYYCGADGKRYVFTNDKNYWTWYSDFSGVTNISDSDLGSIMIGGNVTYRPGVKMIKIQSDPRVYAIAHGGVLRAIGSEAVAACLYGATWNKQIDDISDAFFVNYKVGSDISACSSFDKTAEMNLGQTINADKIQSVPLTFSVTSTTPASGASNVAVDIASLSANFSSSQDPSSVTTSTFTLMKGTVSVAGTVTSSGNLAVFTPAAHLDAGATYTAMLAASIKGMNGKTLPDNYSWTFTTASAADIIPPTVTAVSPTESATNVPQVTGISATFSEAMNVSSINTNSFTLWMGSTPVAGTVLLPVGNTYVFKPTAALGAYTTYTAKIDMTVKDLNGNSLSAVKTWTFTTAY